MLAPVSVRLRKIANEISGWLERSSMATNAATSASEMAIRPSVCDRAPADVDRVDERVDEQRDAGRDRDGAGHVVAAHAGLAALGQQARGHRGGEQRDRDVDEQDPLPAEVLGQHAAEQDADGAAGAGHGAPDAERAVALGTFGEGRGQDRERGGREDRRAEALQRARRDQLALAGRQAAEQRGEREEDEADGEDTTAAEQVGHATAEQQEAAEDERVGVDDPGEVLLGEVEVAADRGQRDVDDRGVEDDDELGCGEQGECKALARYWL